MQTWVLSEKRRVREEKDCEDGNQVGEKSSPQWILGGPELYQFPCVLVLDSHLAKRNGRYVFRNYSP